VKLRVIVILIVAAVVAGGTYMLSTSLGDPYQLAEMIGKYIGPNGEIIDYSNDIGVMSDADIGYKIKSNGTYQIIYGKINIKLDEELLLDKRMNVALNKIGIKVYRSQETGEFYFKYKGEDMSRFI
jgi:hypothetical protein